MVPFPPILAFVHGIHMHCLSPECLIRVRGKSRRIILFQESKKSALMYCCSVYLTIFSRNSHKSDNDAETAKYDNCFLHNYHSIERTSPRNFLQSSQLRWAVA